MSTEHLSAAQCEAFVAGESGSEDAAVVETHVTSCDACAQALAHAARFELALHEVANAPVELNNKRRQRTLIALPLLAVAAAALLLTLFHHSDTQRPPPQLVNCTETSTHADCMKQAHFDGLLTVGPTQRLEVPRYDETPGREKP